MKMTIKRWEYSKILYEWCGVHASIKLGSVNW